MKNLVFICLFFFIGSLHSQDLFLHCGKIIDTENGKTLNNKTIIVSGNKILSIKNGFISPENPNDKVINLKNKTVMPGFIDMHVHLESQFDPKKGRLNVTANDADVAFESIEYAKKTLMAGFTTVRDLGGRGIKASTLGGTLESMIAFKSLF